MGGTDKGLKEDKLTLDHRPVDKGLREDKLTLDHRPVDKGLREDKLTLDGIDKGLTEAKQSHWMALTKGTVKLTLDGTDKGDG